MTDPVLQGNISITTSEGITTITFEHPSHNALPGRLLSLLTEAIDQVSADADSRVIILRSGGDRTFCAGASFDELIAIQDEQQGLTFFSGFANVINALRRSPKLVLGRVQGKAVGGGVGLAAATDYCLATRYASVKLSELAIGIGPFVVGPAVERKVGTSGLSTLAIDATRWQTAEWAEQHGLYAQVFDTADAMDAALHTLARQLADSHPAAMHQLKRTLWQGTDHWDDLLAERAAISGTLVLSDFTRAAIDRFKAG